MSIGPASTPNYAGLAEQAVRTLDDGALVFAGQRAYGIFAAAS
jgi:hypothetical protein